MRDIPALITFRIEKIIFMKVGGGGGGLFCKKWYSPVPAFPGVPCLAGSSVLDCYKSYFYLILVIKALSNQYLRHSA